MHAGQRPKIAVTLSGGGAKGLAHIGILKAIDSAGLHIDYVTGTSMGGIVGGLYAAGYSADSIEKIAHKIDWDVLLSNSSELNNLVMEEKDEYNRYDIELPWGDKKFRLPEGLLESQELWIKFKELFFPVYAIKDFSKLPRPFKCIATDVSTGEAVVLDKGEIVQAIRASMAIPSFFTPVNYDGRKLIDGGVVRNFPVSDAKAMGADFVIGSNVAGGHLPTEKITNVVQVMMQVAFFRNDIDAQQQRLLCNLYINQPLDNYTMASFASAEDIINAGIEKGREMYPVFKHLADSLNNLYGAISNTELLPGVDSVKISQYQINGLKQTTPAFFLDRFQFENNKTYTATDLSVKTRKAFGSRYYNKVVYSLQPLPDGTCKIIFDVDENPLSFAKLAVTYNSFAGASAIVNFTTRDFFTPYSRSLATFNLGGNLGLRAQHLQYFGKSKTFTVTATTQIQSISLNTYDNFLQTGQYKQTYFLGDVVSSFALRRKYSFGIGGRYEYLHYNPSLSNADLQVRGSLNLLSLHTSLKLNTLSSTAFPQRGAKVELEGGKYLSQDKDLIYYTQQNIINNSDSLNFDFGNYIYAKANIEHYFQATSKLNVFTKFQGGINFTKNETPLNGYFIGGLANNIRNQIVFAGLNEGSLVSGSVASGMLGLRYQIYTGTYIIGRGNILYYDFIKGSTVLSKLKFLTGYALSFGYNSSFLGPLEISVMYSDQSRKLVSYFSLGIPF
ncbi:MAG: patatin-like phospholipase family protein [Chitinophagaceae bacterium]|nr:patatin-like phospholipase family protein [Chitinophagaceae bacterium]